jgi:quinol-cytochrome oxidoreductase complex cytochrome b subunit
MSPVGKTGQSDASAVWARQDTHPAESTGTGATQFAVRHWLGALTLLFFCLQVITGILLLVYYRPSTDGAYQSIAIIVDEVRVGWLIRSLHYWSAALLILCSLLHLVQVYFARAYLPPRRASWAAGILLLVAILAFGFTGTLLPWDQYAYWSIDSSRQTIAGIPVVGDLLLNLFWGGWELGEEVLLRFYAFHVGILPWVALACLSVHLVLVWRAGFQGSQPSSVARVLAGVAPNLLIVVLLTFGILVSLAIVLPPELLAPADALSPLPDVQPRWYFLPARQLLRHLSGATAALVVIALFVLLLSVPLIDRRPTETRRGVLIRWILGLSAVVAWMLMAVRQYLSP